MKNSFILGFIGGIFAVFNAIGLFLFALLAGTIINALSNNLALVNVSLQINGLINVIYVLGFAMLLSGVMGIVGSTIRRVVGGLLMIGASMLVLIVMAVEIISSSIFAIAVSLFGILPFVLMLVGGGVALARERARGNRERETVNKQQYDELQADRQQAERRQYANPQRALAVSPPV